MTLSLTATRATTGAAHTKVPGTVVSAAVCPGRLRLECAYATPADVDKPCGRRLGLCVVTALR